MNQEVEIVVVEDDPNDAELTLRALKKKNLANKVVHLKDGVEALDFFFARGDFSGRDVNTLPKVVLLDMKLPKVDGIEVLRTLRADDRTKYIPVVVLTSSKEDKDIIEAYRLGVNSYITKPVEFDGFIQAVSEVGFYWMLYNQTPPN